MAVIVLSAAQSASLYGWPAAMRGEQIVHFHLVAVGAAVPAPGLLAGDVERARAMPFDVDVALGAVGVLGEGFPAARNMAAVAERLQAVGIGELDGVVVVDFAHVLAHADLPAAHALGLDGMALGDPVADVDVVHVLLDDVVAAEPGEIVPVADLVLHFRLARLAGADPHAVELK